jgi:hypothetical protein
MASAQAAAMSDLIAFICFNLLFAGNRPAALTRFSCPQSDPASWTKDGRVMGATIFEVARLSTMKWMGEIPKFRARHCPWSRYLEWSH